MVTQLVKARKDKIEKIGAVRTTVKMLNADMADSGYPFGRGNFRIAKKKLKAMVRESPEAFGGAPISWFEAKRRKRG